MAKLFSSKTADTTTLCYRVRVAMNIKQTDLAAQIGVSCRSVQNWEAGKRRPSGAAQKAMMALSKRYKIKGGEIL